MHSTIGSGFALLLVDIETLKKTEFQYLLCIWKMKTVTEELSSCDSCGILLIVSEATQCGLLTSLLMSLIPSIGISGLWIWAKLLTLG